MKYYLFHHLCAKKLADFLTTAEHVWLKNLLNLYSNGLRDQIDNLHYSAELILGIGKTSKSLWYSSTLKRPLSLESPMDAFRSTNAFSKPDPIKFTFLPHDGIMDTVLATNNNL